MTECARPWKLFTLALGIALLIAGWLYAQVRTPSRLLRGKPDDN